MRCIRFKIMGKSWLLRSLSHKQYHSKKYRRGSVAITRLHKRRIDLSPQGRDKETIVHELVHAYMTELCIHSMTPSPDDVEEFFCELMAKYGRKLLALADSLHLKLRKLHR